MLKADPNHRLGSLRLAVGTLTIFRVQAPATVTRELAGRAMLWAPAVGAVIGAIAATVLEVSRHVTRHSIGGTLLSSVAAVATLAFLTRGLHLDGLADTADGLGSGRDAAGALDVMKRSDIGPFGVLTLVLTLLVQVFALYASVALGSGGLSVLIGAVVGRLAAAWGCAKGLRIARPGGLGATFVGSVPAVRLVGLRRPPVIATSASPSMGSRSAWMQEMSRARSAPLAATPSSRCSRARTAPLASRSS